MARQGIWGCIKCGRFKELGGLQDLRVLLRRYISRVGDVLPPIVVDPVDAPACFREVFHPPFVMFTGIAVAPIGGGDLASDTFEVGEVV